VPTSALAVAPTVIHYLWEVRPQDRPLRVLDVGPGWGKYGTLVREYVDPDAWVEGVEAWAPYVDRHRLRAKYDGLRVEDIRDTDAEYLATFDAVLMVDVIEHVPKADALQVLDRIPGWVIVSTPRHFFENPADLPDPEAHVSHWTVRDFEATGRLDAWHRPSFNDLAGIVCRLRPL
jgi:2-polyprenyl-3-methyl-5-hydroxy-6-metoxy-1,4-benzoquinol methylase